MTLVQFIYKTILCTAYYCKVTYNNNESSSTVGLLLVVVVALPCCIWLLTNMVFAGLTKDEGENPYLKREHMQGRTPFCHRDMIMKMKMSTKGPYKYLPPDICTETYRLDSPVSDSILPTCKASTLLARPEGTIYHTRQQQQLQLTDTADQKQNEPCT